MTSENGLVRTAKVFILCNYFAWNYLGKSVSTDSITVLYLATNRVGQGMVHLSVVTCQAEIKEAEVLCMLNASTLWTKCGRRH